LKRAKFNSSGNVNHTKGAQVGNLVTGGFWKKSRQNIVWKILTKNDAVMNLTFIKLYNQENLSLMEVHRKFIKLWFSCSRAEYFFISSEESEVGNNFNEVATIYAWIKGFIVSTQHDFNDNIIFFHQITFMFEFQHGWVIVTVSDKKNTPFWLGQLLS